MRKALVRLEQLQAENTRLSEERRQLKIQRDAADRCVEELGRALLNEQQRNTPLRSCGREWEQGACRECIACLKAEVKWLTFRCERLVETIRRREPSLPACPPNAIVDDRLPAIVQAAVTGTTSDKATLWKPNPACTCGAYDAASLHAGSCAALRTSASGDAKGK